MTRTLLTALALAGLLLAGCSGDPRRPRDIEPDKKTNDKSGNQGNPPPPVEAGGREVLPPPHVEGDKPKTSSTKQPGVIRGLVTWDGPPPTATAKAEECVVSINGKKVMALPPTTPRVDATTKGVADVMVWLDKAPASLPPVVAAASLTQSRGEYRPRAQFVTEGTRVSLRTTDDEADFSGSGRLRFTRQLRRGEQGQVVFPRTGLITIRSDERPWMASAYVRVIEHGCHAVTDREGRFELPPLPPGEYEVLLWPAGWSRDGKNVRQRVKVAVSAGQGAQITWALAQR